MCCLWGIRLKDKTVSGTVTEEGTVIEKEYAMALGEYRGTLYIASVDGYSSENGTVTVL